MMPAAPPVQGRDGWRWLATAAAVLGLAAVLLGAVGSHAVDLDSDGAALRWNTALQVHYFQAAAIMALAALAAAQGHGHRLLLPGLLQVAGTVLFCSTLYLRALQFGWFPGWLAPLGGLILISGWLLLAFFLVNKPR